MAAEQPDLNAIIGERLADFDKPGVLSVRPGFKIKNDWLTGAPSIVVTVRKKVAHPPEGELLPSQVAGVPVDVRQASPEKRLELEDPEAYSSQLRLTPDTGSVPHFPDERTLAGIRPAAASAHAQLAAIKKPQLDYSGPDGVTLQPIEADATVMLSASPDTGWPVLRDFLSATAGSLTVGLYDFTAAHIATAIQTDLAGKQLKLVLDHPPLNPTADQSDATTVADLSQAFGSAFSQAWALTRLDKEATAWIFPTAYHIKVAVRDRSALWLSSGNWNNSNQPAIDPFTNPADTQEARHRDRDWHVVIQQPQLAGVFEDYILHDLAVAAEHNNPPEQPGAPLAPPPLGSKKTREFGQFFPAASVTGTIKIAPLLTPDPGVYADAVRAFVVGATRTLYMQFQYIEPPKAGSTDAQGFIDLINAVIDRQGHGVEVKIIMSEFEKAGYLEQLEGMGLDTVNNVKIQNNVHNKGIIVDGSAVLVSSQNWSSDGTLYNRDAGVIIYNETAAEYFQQIFLHDWNHLAIKKVRSD
jgi:phospholipase D-like protein